MKRFGVLWPVLFSIMLPLIADTAAHACSCIKGEARLCTRANYDAIFSGKVTSIVQGTNGLEVYFKVADSFKGDIPKEAVVYTAASGASCGYPFEAGKEYLVYAEHVGGLLAVASKSALTVILCGDTHLFSTTTPAELEFLQNLDQSNPAGSIYGTLNDARANEDSKPLEGVRVIAESGKKKYSDRTDKKGAFNIDNLPPGKYQITAVLPNELVLNTEDNHDLEVVPHGCSNVKLESVNNGSIAGRVTSADGQPLGNIDVWAWGKGWYSVLSAPDGRYVIHGIPAGEYEVGVNIGFAYPTTDVPYPHTYYPGTTDATNAKELVIGSGTHLSDIDFALPPPLTAQTVIFEAVNEDGTPAARAYFAREAREYAVLVHDIQADDKGHASAQFLRGLVYEIQGHAITNGKMVCAPPDLTIRPGEFPERLRIVLTAESCRVEGNKLTRENFLRVVKNKAVVAPIRVTWSDDDPAYAVTVLIDNPKYDPRQNPDTWVFLNLTTDKAGVVEMPLPVGEKFTLIARGANTNDYGCESDMLLVNTEAGVRWRKGVPRFDDPAAWNSIVGLQTAPINLVLAGSCNRH